MGELILKNLDIGYNGRSVIRDFNLTVANGEMVSLLGPSGAGKTPSPRRRTLGMSRPF